MHLANLSTEHYKRPTGEWLIAKSESGANVYFYILFEFDQQY